MKYYTVSLRLSGPLPDAVAVEWTAQAIPVDSGQGWEPCLRQLDGTWRFSSHDLSATEPPHLRTPGAFGDIAIRYRLNATGPWSVASPERKEIEIVETTETDPEPVEPAPTVAPVLVAAPVLAGVGEIGAELSVTTGVWTGAPGPRIAFQWRRDGADIPGAAARAYVPGPEDDLCEIACAVTATNVAGEVVAVTAALAITYPAPTAIDALAEEVFDEAPGAQRVETEHVFAGANLTFAVTGPGAAIDPRTGVLSLSTETPVSGRTVTVAAANSGGEARVPLDYTVEAAPPGPTPDPEALGAADLEVLRSVWRPDGTQSTYFTPIVAFPGLEGRTVDAIEWTTTPGDVPEAHWEIVVARPDETGAFDLWMRNPANRNPAAVPKVDYAVFDAGEAARRALLRFRWRASPAGPWSAPSAYAEAPLPAPAVAPPPPTPVPAPGGANLWRPLPARPQLAFGAAKADYPDYYAKGEYFGGGPQACHAGWREGEDVFLYGDMHGARRSRDGGRTWHHLNAWGHAGWGASGIARDPVDPNRIILFGARVWESGTAQLSTSVDGGVTFPYNTAVPNGANYNHRIKCNQICYWPVSGGSSSTRKWRVTAWHENGSSSGGVTLLTSTNGGQSWSSAVIAGWSGRRVHRLTQSPHAEGTLYAATNQGLFVSTNNGVNWSQIMAGDCRDVWEDPAVPNRLIVARYADGLWYRANGASGFVQVLARSAMVSMSVGGVFDGNKRRLFAARQQSADNYSDRRIYVQEWVMSGAPLGSVSNNYTTSGWFRGQTIAYDPSDGSEHWRIVTGEGFHGMHASQTNTLECSVDAYGVPWITTDGGKTFRMSSTGYHGENIQGLGFDFWDPAWIGMGISDTYLYESANAGDVFTRQGYNMGAWNTVVGGNSFGCNGVVRIPNVGAVPAAARGRRIALVGNNWGNTALLRRDATATAWTQMGGTDNRSFMEISRQNPNLVYVDNLRSFDAGGSFGGMAYRVCGVSAQNGNHVVGHNGAGTFATSTDAGSNWTGWFSTGQGIRIGSFNRFALSPHDWTRCVTRGAGDDVVLRNGAAQVTLNLRGAIAAAMGAVPGHWYLSGLGWCPLNPRRIYACGNAPGGSIVWRGMISADYTSCVWTDITTNFTRTVQPPYLRVHPVTGDVFVGKGGGVWALPPQDELHPASIWANLPKPLPNGATY